MKTPGMSQAAEAVMAALPATHFILITIDTNLDAKCETNITDVKTVTKILRITADETSEGTPMRIDRSGNPYSHN